MTYDDVIATHAARYPRANDSTRARLALVRWHVAHPTYVVLWRGRFNWELTCLVGGRGFRVSVLVRRPARFHYLHSDPRVTLWRPVGRGGFRRKGRRS